MANLGLIAGRVYSPGGGFTAANVDVAMSALLGSDGVPVGYSADSNRKFIRTTTDEKGLFWIRFAWSGPDIGSAPNYADASVSAFNDVESNGYLRNTKEVTSRTAPRTVRLPLFRNFAAVMNTAGSSFRSVPETMDFAVDLWAGLGNVKFYTAWKTVSLWGTESWALCGGLELTLGQ